MKKIFLFLAAALLLSVSGVAAADEASDVIGRMCDRLRAASSYEVRFDVAAADYTARGRYAVEGERYYVCVGDTEVYGDSRVRYEVNNTYREIVVDVPQTAGGSLLDDPVHGLDNLSALYSAEMVSHADGVCVVRLTPADSTQGGVTVEIDSATSLPRAIRYDAGGDTVAITVGDVVLSGVAVPHFDAKSYKGYETVDFRD